jgi:flagellar biosynthesis protein FlhA
MPEAVQGKASLPTEIPYISKNVDILLAGLVVCVLGFMIIPLPSILLDLLITFNITFSMVILLVGMYILKPMELSSLPSLLLILTLFRLSLNVASTRLILLHGHEGTAAAGKVIMAFGAFVVGGNYLVGIIIFLILVVINFMVITKGATRIAEVAARFTLDSLPGRQMSIDADLNAGYISEREAVARRKELSLECEYYGAMDGANKFVRGDATAGIIITLVNIIGGLAIGMFQNDMALSDAAKTYTILTVGDGLVTQIPALIVSSSVGIIVSRAKGESKMGKDMTHQILFQPRAIAVASVVLIGFGLIPGLPTLPFLIMGVLAGLLSYTVFSTMKTSLASEEEKEKQAQAVSKQAAPDQIQSLPPVDALALEVGYGLIPLVDVNQNGELLDRIRSIRRQIANEIGVIIPSVHIQDNMQLKPGEYAIMLKGNQIGRGELMVNYYLAMNPGTAQEKIKGIPTKEPTYGLPAYWIKEEQKDAVMAKGYTVVDLPTVLTTHISELIRRHAHELLGRQEVNQLLDNLKETHPKVVEELIPGLMSVGSVGKILQNLLKEQVPIRDLVTILETLADFAPSSKDTDLLTEYARQALSRTITKLYQTPQGTIPLITLDQGVEAAIAGAIGKSDQGNFLAMEPAMVQKIIKNLTGHLEKFGPMNLQPVVMCSAQIRSHFKKLMDRYIPNLVVLSYNDVLTNVKIQSLGTVGLTDAN